ncbi:MAG: hypothetical protein H6622_17850 [Halobacteriovoraceae bacterium]|nr:hypothetical protein [Halobacteriovoraceae bacterium]
MIIIISVFNLFIVPIIEDKYSEYKRQKKNEKIELEKKNKYKYEISLANNPDSSQDILFKLLVQKLRFVSEPAMQNLIKQNDPETVVKLVRFIKAHCLESYEQCNMFDSAILIKEMSPTQVPSEVFELLSYPSFSRFVMLKDFLLSKHRQETHQYLLTLLESYNQDKKDWKGCCLSHANQRYNEILHHMTIYKVESAAPVVEKNLEKVLSFFYSNDPKCANDSGFNVDTINNMITYFEDFPLDAPKDLMKSLANFSNSSCEWQKEPAKLAKRWLMYEESFIKGYKN